MPNMTGKTSLPRCQTVFLLLFNILSNLVVHGCTLCSAQDLSESLTRELTTRLLLEQNTPPAVQVCTQTEYYCGAGDKFLGSAHDALNKPGNCVLDKGASRRISHFSHTNFNTLMSLCISFIPAFGNCTVITRSRSRTQAININTK